MSDKLKKYYFLFVATLFFAVTGNFARADADIVEVTLDPVGSFGPGFIIDEPNILPGDSFFRKMVIVNNTGDARLVMLQFNAGSYADSNTGLESEIMIEIKKSNGDPIAFPLPSGTTLKDLCDETKAINFDILEPSASQSYEIIFTFNPLATEQGKGETKFDIILGVDSDPYNPPKILKTTNDGGGDGGGGRHRRGGGGGGAPGGGIFGGLFSGVETTQGAVENFETSEQGQRVAGEEISPEVAGEATTCRGWPLWVWILSLAIFTLNFWRNARENYKQEKYRWIFPFIWTIAAAVFWYFFDKCREYQWFLYGSIIIAIISYFTYLYFLRKKARKHMPIAGETENKA